MLQKLHRLTLVLPLVLAPSAAQATPLFTEATANLGSPQPCGPGETEGCYSNYVVLADLDGDGDLDAVFASGGGYYEPGDAQLMALYLNDGAGRFTESSASATGGFTGRLRQVAVGDIDGDGRLDAITAQGEAGAYLNRLYLGTEAQAADTRAPTFRAVQHDASTSAGNVVLHFAVADATTTDVGPRLREAHVKLSADGTDIPAQFMGGDLYRAVVPVGTPGVHKFKACATDAAGNSACSEEFQFTRVASASDGGPDPASGAGHEVGPKDEGCDCRMGRGASGGGGALVLLLGALALLRRRVVA